MNSTRAPSWPFDQTVVGFGIPHVVFPLDFDNHARLVIFVMVVVLILVVHVSPCPYDCDCDCHDQILRLGLPWTYSSHLDVTSIFEGAGQRVQKK
jgi:hypothetical protein